MALFKNMAITNQGMALYAKAQAGQEIHFTKMQVGSGLIETQNPVTLLALLDPKLDVPITSITANPEMKSATIIGNITNKDVTEATYICELGLFAKDPEEGEILYGYVSAGQYGDYYAPEAQGPYSWQYEINAAIGNAANVTAEVSRLNWDHSVINSNKTFLHLEGGNQKEINKSIDNLFQSFKSDLADITTDEDRLTENKTITGAINELFTFASNGKIKIATAITGKGVQASGSDSFDTLSNKITSIKVGDCNFGDVFPVSKIELVNKQPQIWNFIGHSSKVNAIAVDKSGYIYSGSDDNTFKEINSNGQQVLSFNPDNTPVKKIAVDKNGYIYIATNKSVIKMDKQGNIFWSYNFPYINSLTVDSAGYVYAASTSAICINPNGEKEWITSSGDTINAIAVTGNGNVYTGKQNQSSSLKKIVGEPKWYNTYYNADYIATDAMEGDYSSIYVASCLNVKEIRDHGDHADTGWTTKISNYPDYAMYFVSTLKLYNNRIYIGTKESVVKLDKQGNILWRFNTDNVRVNAIAVDGNENMYIGSDDNTVKKLIDGVAIISRS
ncbi:hypothetical protein [Clostridium botulinum]|uniref:hypothetical protein n=1 Tax=Clostridium botulinum TaxID=1491 RepID=UPI0013F09833|nr:hypothetical protein [Clostridium botulinum]EGT5649334.1 hypothetical protein [Clostridium botulinum]MBY6755532.1 hypothetical protein [Clostridium botulinum]MBY6766459.1 hypothetical protein [Clostridium botulinum]NFR74384.1 hypothetical protein [Clostridium botulinum]